MKVFALQGPGSSGKTDTLIRVLSALQKKYPTAITQEHHSGTRDIKVILTGVNGLTVGIESQGDPGSRLEESLKDFVKAKCDIIFCACRTRGMTTEWVKALSPKYTVSFVSQTVVRTGFDQANSAMAASLIKKAGL